MAVPTFNFPGPKTSSSGSFGGAGAFSKGLDISSSFISAGFAIADAGTIREIGRVNAQAFLRENDVARIASRERVRDVRRQFQFVQGTQVARFGASGVLLEGSALNVVAETSGELKRSILREEWNLANFIAVNNYRAAISRAEATAASNRKLVEAGLSFAKGFVGVAGAFG